MKAIALITIAMWLLVACNARPSNAHKDPSCLGIDPDGGCICKGTTGRKVVYGATNNYKACTGKDRLVLDPGQVDYRGELKWK